MEKEQLGSKTFDRTDTTFNDNDMPKKSWNKVRNITGTFAPLNQQRIMNYLVDHLQDDLILEHTGLAEFDGVWLTSHAVREMGMIVCSECGCITSDSRYECPKCEEPIVFIMHNPIYTINKQKNEQSTRDHGRDTLHQPKGKANRQSK